MKGIIMPAKKKESKESEIKFDTILKKVNDLKNLKNNNFVIFTINEKKYKYICDIYFYYFF